MCVCQPVLFVNINLISNKPKHQKKRQGSQACGRELNMQRHDANKAMQGCSFRPTEVSGKVKEHDRIYDTQETLLSRKGECC